MKPAATWLAVTPSADVPGQPVTAAVRRYRSTCRSLPFQTPGGLAAVRPGCFTPRSVKRTDSVGKHKGDGCSEASLRTTQTCCHVHGGTGAVTKASPPHLCPTRTRVASRAMRLPRASPDRGNHAVTPAETNSGPVLVSLGTVSPAARSPSSAQKEKKISRPCIRCNGMFWKGWFGTDGTCKKKSGFHLVIL